MASPAAGIAQECDRFQLTLHFKLCEAVTENHFNSATEKFCHNLVVIVRIVAAAELRQDNPLAWGNFSQNDPIKKLLLISH
ncbi:hypothetical protein [Nostoc sp.]|uniref:hypothetical protein n=1 Tax=Nostoc sp. TaxID=1180 RepID=UPI002FF8CE84